MENGGGLKKKWSSPEVQSPPVCVTGRSGKFVFFLEKFKFLSLGEMPLAISGENFLVNPLNFLLEDRQVSNIDFDYAFDEFKPISVKLLDDDTKKTNRTAFHWSDIGGMEDIKQELIQTVQWRFEVKNIFISFRMKLFIFFVFSIQIIFLIHLFD